MAQTYLADGKWNEYGRMMSRAVGLIPGLSGDVVFAAPETNLWRSIARDRSLLVLYFKNFWYGKAFEASNRLTREVPDDLFGWYYRALCLEARDHQIEARESFLEVIKIQPNLTAAYLGLGRVAIKTGAYEEAEAAFQKALGLDPESSLGHVFLGDLHLKRGEIGAAVKSYRQALDLEPMAPEAYPRLSRLLAENEDTFQEAALLSKKAERLAPEDPFTLDAAGWIMVLEGNVDGGMEKILSAQKKGMEDPVTLYHLGYALYRKKDFQNSRQVLQKAVQLSRSFPGVDRALEILKELALETDSP
jgi:tetratricopeptide (TPR) repeat protein